MRSGSTKPRPGDVWFADLGMAEKSRPVLVLAMPDDRDARSLAVVVPLISQIRQARGEVSIGKPSWLPKPSAINVQGIASFDPGKLVRHLGTLPQAQILQVKEAIRTLLDL